MVNLNCPEYLSHLVPNHLFSNHAYNTRGRSDLYNVFSRTQNYYDSFLPYVVREWNKIPTEFRFGTLNAFKKYLDRDQVKIPTYYSIGLRRGQI